MLSVRDDGPGPGQEDARSGVGLTNTRSRLEHLYGDRHRFEFQSVPGGGLAVTIVIPLVRESEASVPADMESVA